MKVMFASILIILASASVPAQDARQKIYDTERAFEKMVAERGINEGFIEFMSPVGIIFAPDVANGRETWQKRPPSPAGLTWNPIRIDASSNGALGYSVGNSMYRPKGKDDPNIFYGHYLSVWSREPGGEYRAALDTGISHDKPSVIPTDWKPSASAASGDPGHAVSGGDGSTQFFSAVLSSGAASAYQTYLADDAIVMRDGIQPFFGRKAAVEYLKKAKTKIVFARRKSFIEAGDLAYVNSTYKLVDSAGADSEHGNFVQVWKLIGGKWKIAAEVFVPLPASTK